MTPQGIAISTLSGKHAARRANEGNVLACSPLSWKRWRLWALPVLLLFGIAVSSPALAESPPTASLVVEPRACDAGERTEGDSIAYSVTASNAGPHDIRILGVRSECPCVTTTHPGVIPAGGSARIDFAVDAKDRRGPLSERVRIVTDDPQNAEVDIELRAQIAPVISVSPTRVSLMGIVGDALQAEVALKANKADSVDAWVEQVSDPDKFSCALTSGGARGEWKLLVANHVTGSGTYRGRVLLRTTSPDKPALVVPVFVRISNEASVAPEALELEIRDSPQGKTIGRMQPLPREGELIVRGARGNLHITGVENPDGVLASSVQTVEEGKLYRITVRPKPERLREGVTDAVLIVRTDASTGGIIRTPVRITLRSGGRQGQ